MDSNTAYHFSRLLQPHPTSATVRESLKWNGIECVRRGGVQRRKKREKNFRASWNSNRNATPGHAARSYYVPRASNFTPSSPSLISTRRLFPSLFFYHSPEKHSTTKATSLPRGRDAEEIDPRARKPYPALAFRSPVAPPRGNNPSNRSRRGTRNRRIGGIDRNVDRVEANNGTRAINGGTLDARSERTVAGHGLLLIDFTGSATRRVITSESCASPGQSFHLSRINYDRSGIIRRLIRIRGGGEGEDGW